ncbi:SGNH hydrolase-type esterase domain-containing protein [Microdochium bolleyi]|uniref:SGNH hydrolase-type esterase domain-containing protein n=1 Tax=Microdochium bolleyi TaxID=196109 RepID=A0A136IUS3_9PEZI|nr:SGNH hydrolase-type esterase domain-containing protein [Microdochium bolleyi]
MKFSATLAALALGVLASAAPAPAPAPVEVAPRAGPTVYLCGDSTMAGRGANDGQTDGWGAYLGRYLNIPVVNKAIGGRSARSFWNEGRFQEVANLAKSGDIVVIEFGHNDGGSPRSNDNGRSACPGTGTETCVSDKDGKTVYTYPFYIIQGSKLMLAKGATVILSSQTPKNQWQNGVYNDAAPRFVDYQRLSRDALASASVTFVDHFRAVSNMYKKLGSGAVNAFYPKDYTHTSPGGADASAKAFTQAIYQKLNGATSLAPHVKTPVNIVY